MSPQWADYTVVLVLAAALMHALWNAVLKIQGERAVVVLMITAGAALGGALATLVLPLPDVAAWPYLILSSLIHCGYFYCLSAAYQRCDLSVAYPIARGGAPAVVLVIALVLLDEPMSGSQLIGVLLLAAGILSLAWGPLTRAQDWHGPAWAALTAVCIAAYTTSDGIGARLAGNPHSYAAWLFVAQFVPICLFVLWRYHGQIKPVVHAHWHLGLLAGLLSLASYWVVIWAMTVLSVPVVVALRETSVLFAMLLGVLWLNEPWSRGRWLSVCVVLVGVLLLRL